MAYQRVERTMFVIERSHLVPNPFDADPSSTIVIVNSDLGTPNRQARIALKRHVPWATPSEGRLTLRSHGPDQVGDRRNLRDLDERSGESFFAERQRRWVNRIDGLLILAAPATVLREWGMTLTGLGQRWYNGSAATELDWPVKDGGVQVFRDFDERVSAAIVARRRLFPGREHAEMNADERQQVWSLGAAQRE